MYTLIHTGWQLRNNHKYNRNQDWRQKQRKGGQTERILAFISQTGWSSGYESTERKGSV